MSKNISEALILLGFDVGKRRTGVAIGQTITKTARSLDTLQSQDGLPDWRIVDNLIHQWQPDALVVGLPPNTSDNKEDMQKIIRRFCHCLRNRYSISVYTHDESYTSVEAYRQLKLMRQAGRRKRISKAEIDSLSAALLLESWMTHSETALGGV